MTSEEFCQKYCMERRGTGCIKWDSLEELFGESDLIPLWVADMEFKAPDGVIEAIEKQTAHGVLGYAKVQDNYFESFAAWQKKRCGMEVNKDEFRFCTGVVAALYSLVNAFTQLGDAAMICSPVYHPFYEAVRNTGRTLLTCELDNNNGIYSFNCEKFEKIISENNIKLFILCSPHNPVGRVWRKDELKGIFEICKKYGVLVISDEIHQDFIWEENQFIPASVLENGKYKDMLITVNSASKTFNLAGLTLSHTLIYNKDLRQKYDDYIKTIGHSECNLFSLIGMEAAYRTGGEWLEYVKAVIYSNYEYMRNELMQKAPKAIITPLEGTYLMWIDLRAYLSSDDVNEFMIKKCKLAVNAGEKFGSGSKGFIRINLATDPKYIKIAAERITQNLFL